MRGRKRMREQQEDKDEDEQVQEQDEEDPMKRKKTYPKAQNDKTDFLIKVTQHMDANNIKVSILPDGNVIMFKLCPKSDFSYEKMEGTLLHKYLMNNFGESASDSRLCGWIAELNRKQAYQYCYLPELHKSKDHEYVEFKNGVYDITENRLIAKKTFNIWDIHTTCFFDVDFVPNAPPKNFLYILRNSFKNRIERRRFLYHFGKLWHTKERGDTALFFVGPPQCGKSTLFEVFKTVYGKENIAIINSKDKKNNLKNLTGKNIRLGVFDKFRFQHFERHDLMRIFEGTTITARGKHEKTSKVEVDFPCVVISNSYDIYPVIGNTPSQIEAPTEIIQRIDGLCNIEPAITSRLDIFIMESLKNPDKKIISEEIMKEAASILFYTNIFFCNAPQQEKELYKDNSLDFNALFSYEYRDENNQIQRINHVSDEFKNFLELINE